MLRAEKRLGAIDAELAEPHTYADRDVLNRLLDERGSVEGRLQREYKEWEKLVDEAGLSRGTRGPATEAPRATLTTMARRTLPPTHI